VDSLLQAVPPGVPLVVGALLFPLLRARRRLMQGWLLILPVLSGLHLLALPEGVPFTVELFGQTLEPVRIDRLSLVWGYVFHVAAFLSSLYALHVRDAGQHTAALAYAGSAIGAVFAGDLVTLFVYWELTAVTSVFLVWARRTERAYRSGMRYLVIQVASGVLLLGGIAARVAGGGSVAFGELGLRDLPTALILIAFGVKAAFPLLHNWLQDAYPEATPTGAVFLSAFTTKMAVYALARGFPGTDLLIWIGVAMAVFPIFYGLVADDLRRVLAYSLNDQLGFMVVGVGIGSELALAGTAAHAFVHVLYKGLLFMSMGAVLHRTGTCRCSGLGGLARTMPWTAGFCIVGALSISAFPFTSGFVSKSLILTAAAEEHLTAAWLLLLLASAGVFLYSGIKVPWAAFFGRDSGKRPQEAPLHMRLAMGIAAAFCVGAGTFPQLLYGILPHPVEYHPYTLYHLVTQLQLLAFAGLAYLLLKLWALYPAEERSTILDFDWLYRRALPVAIEAVTRVGDGAWHRTLANTRRALDHGLDQLRRSHGPGGLFARPWSVGATAFFVAVLLGGYLLLYFWLGVG